MNRQHEELKRKAVALINAINSNMDRLWDDDLKDKHDVVRVEDIEKEIAELEATLIKKPTKGDLVTANNKQWRILEVETDMFRGVEYRENDNTYMPEIKTMNLKEIE